VVGVVKHMPGHGRAMCDSHKDLPIVEAGEEELAIDLEPFERLNWAPMGMMAHVVYTAWDSEAPASQSATVIREIVRERIGFDGWLMSDDIGMEALKGGFAERAAGVVEAGCDVALHCSGKMEEMVAVASAVPAMSARAEERLRQAMVIAASAEDGPPFEELVAKRDELLALA
jgi:beta-N-acetylhexosaminidase